MSAHSGPRRPLARAKGRVASWQFVRTVRAGPIGAATEAVALRIAERLPPPADVLDLRDDTYRDFFYPSGTDWLSVAVTAIRQFVDADRELRERRDRLRNQAPAIGFVVSSGRSGTRSVHSFLASNPTTSSLHRPGDLDSFARSDIPVDPRRRNTVMYSLLTAELNETFVRRELDYVMDLAEFAVTHGKATSTDFWFAAHRWNCYIPFFVAILDDVRMVDLRRPPEKIVSSLIGQSQYCPRHAHPLREETWVNFEPMRRGHETPPLALSGAPQFDRACWYVCFVTYLAACLGQVAAEVSQLEIDEMRTAPASGYSGMSRVADVGGISVGEFASMFEQPSNLKPRSLTRALSFPAPDGWSEAMHRRLREISASFPVVDYAQDG